VSAKVSFDVSPYLLQRLLHLPDSTVIVGAEWDTAPGGSVLRLIAWTSDLCPDVSDEDAVNGEVIRAYPFCTHTQERFDWDWNKPELAAPTGSNDG